MSHSVPSCRVSQPQVLTSPDVGPNLPQVDDLCAEVRVLHQGLDAVETGTPNRALRSLAKSVLLSRGVFLSTEEEKLVSGALAKLAGEDLDSFHFDVSSEVDWTEEVTLTVSQTWLKWAAGFEVSPSVLEDLRSRQSTEEPYQSGQSGAVNLMALYFWLSAVLFLIQGDLATSKRVWKRAIDVGSQFGTDSHLAISWTFVATFLPLED